MGAIVTFIGAIPAMIMNPGDCKEEGAAHNARSAAGHGHCLCGLARAPRPVLPDEPGRTLKMPRASSPGRVGQARPRSWPGHEGKRLQTQSSHVAVRLHEFTVKI